MLTLSICLPLQHFKNRLGLAPSVFFVPPTTLSSSSSLSPIGLDWLLFWLLIIASNVAPATTRLPVVLGQEV
jgi:hypothetical protein